MNCKYVRPVTDNCKIEFIDISIQLSNLGAKYLQIRFFAKICSELLKKIIRDFNSSTIEGIEILLPFNREVELNDLIDLRNEFKRISYFIVYNSSYGSQSSKKERIIFINENIKSEKHCGLISHNYFTNDMSHFSESQHHNTCLNRKISIDVNGNIKNCPSMSESFGNIKDTTLAEAIEKPGFKKFWNHKKDDIKVCQDCEFRYICTDCRAYLEDQEDEYSKPLKCGYNPYSGEWSEWSTNPLKQKEIKYYGMDELV